MSMKIEEKVSLVKTNLGLTLKTIASATCVTDATVCRYINGIKEIPNDWLELFCEAFHVEAEWMKAGEGDPVFTEKTDASITGDTSGTGKRLLQMRQELGIDRKTVYKALGVTHAMYSRLESGQSRLTKENAEKLEDHFGYGVDWILYGDERKKEYPIGKSMMEWLWENKEERKLLWQKMKSSTISE
jgi:transcriptional regulator with XRE-family HTH domain